MGVGAGGRRHFLADGAGLELQWMIAHRATAAGVNDDEAFGDGVGQAGWWFVAGE